MQFDSYHAILVLFAPFSISILHKLTNEFCRFSSIIRTPLRHSVRPSGVLPNRECVMTGERFPSALQPVFRHLFLSAF